MVNNDGRREELFKTAVFGSLGIIFFCVGLYFLMRAASLSGFEKTTGRIEYVTVDTEQRFRYRRRFYYYETYYIPRVVFSYEVDGKKYRGERFTIPDKFYTRYRDEAEKMVAGMKKGSPVEVFYDPDEPSRSALKVEAAGYTEWGVPLFVVGLILGGLTVLFFFIERAQIEERTLRTAMPYRGVKQG